MCRCLKDYKKCVIGEEDRSVSREIIAQPEMGELMRVCKDGCCTAGGVVVMLLLQVLKCNLM